MRRARYRRWTQTSLPLRPSTAEHPTGRSEIGRRAAMEAHRRDRAGVDVLLACGFTKRASARAARLPGFAPGP
jgi:hypothetical protein